MATTKATKETRRAADLPIMLENEARVLNGGKGSAELSSPPKPDEPDPDDVVVKPALPLALPLPDPQLNS